MLNPSDKSLIQKINNGEIDNFTFIVRKYEKRVYNFVAKKIRNREDIEDIVQISFLQFYKAISRFDPEKQILPYLFQIVRNEMKMFWRKNRQTLPLNEEIAAEEKPEFPDFEFLKKQLGKLNQEQKKALQFISEGFSYKEVAKFLGRPVNTIRTIIRRARLKLTGKKTKQYEKT